MYKRKVRSAYSGMDVSGTALDDPYFAAMRQAERSLVSRGGGLSGSGLYGDSLSGAQARGAASITDRANNSSGTASFSRGLSQASNGNERQRGAGINGGNVSGIVNGTIGLIDAYNSEKVDRDSVVYNKNDKQVYGGGPNVGRAALKGAGSGAALGASVGSFFPGAGTAIGGAVGAVAGAAVGFFGAKSAQRKYKQAVKDREKEMTRVQNIDSNAQYLTQTFAAGGAIAAPESKSGENAVVLGGNLHEDGGNPVVDGKTGEKVLETEREELMFTSEQTKEIESLIGKFESGNDELDLIRLGQYVKTIVDTQMTDNSGMYGKA